MTSFEFPLDSRMRDGELAPVQEWLDEICQRLDGWSKSVKAVSAEEWTRLRSAVAGTFSATRVENVVREILKRVGVKSREVDLEQVVAELRLRVRAYRTSLTIENYPQYLMAPPQLRL